MMKVVCCPHCESILEEYYDFEDKEICKCRHCGEWETLKGETND
jgi:uncharacterized protein YbaR (Trm112 family)